MTAELSQSGPWPAPDSSRSCALLAVACLIGFLHGTSAVELPGANAAPSKLEFVNTSFENASPLQWEQDSEGVVHIFLLYDYERNSPNRAAGHWHFQLQGPPGSDYSLILHNFNNIYNGRIGVPVSKKSICYVSSDGKQWKVIPAEFLEGNRLRLQVHLEGSSLYLARLEPYRLSDLEALLQDIRNHPLVDITRIGKTVEGRPLELVRIGRPEAPFRILLRARAHAWEPGGNWVVQGLIRGLLGKDDVAARSLRRYCLYVMPMANKDGVVRGLTRFNLLGCDLNRGWDKPPEARLAPENAALETWLNQMAQQDRLPHFAIDLHNDESGKLHISKSSLPGHLEKMRRFEELLRCHTWFREGSIVSSSGVPATLGQGLLERFGIDACILELNCNWIAGLQQPPSAAAWEQFGRDLREVFHELSVARE